MKLEEPTVVGVDLGGTHLRAALVTREGRILSLVRTEVDGQTTSKLILRRITSCVQDLISSRRPSPEAVCLAVPGGVEAGTGIVNVSPNYPKWKNFDIATPLRASIGLPVVVANDNNAAAIGELWKGNRCGVDTFFYVALGTGVGGGIVTDGKMHYGVNGMAGEIGHTMVDPSGPRCGCGRSGCLETFASGKAIARMATASLGKRGARILRQLAESNGGKLEGVDVYRAALLGDPCARAIFTTVGRSLGSALADVIHVLNPPLIIVGGQAARAWRFFIPSTREVIRRSCFPLAARSCRIARSNLIDRCGVLGAARIAWDLVERS